MASVNKVTTTVLPTVARTTGETSDFYSPSPTSLPTTDPSQPADSVSTSPALNDTTSSFPLSNTADYIARDAFLNSSATGGTEGSSITSSASLSPSTTGFNATTEPFSGSSAWNVTTSTPGLPDISDGLTGQGDVVNTTASAGDVVSTTLPPTPSSSVLWSSPPVISASSVPGNGTIGTGSAEDTPLSHLLVIAIPVAVALLIAIAVIVYFCLRCCRRKKEKEEKQSGPEDLWVRPDSEQVVMVDLTANTNPPAAKDAGDATTPLPKAATLNQSDESLFVAIYDFPAQQDTQLTLTRGDVILVQEKADHGWWRGTKKGDNRSGWFPSSFVAPVNHADTNGAARPEPDKPPEPPQERSEEPPVPRPRISSFLIRKKPSKRNFFNLASIRSQSSGASSESRAVSAPVSPVSPVSVRPSSALFSEDFSASVKDKYFRVLFSYKAAYRGELSLKEGEVIVGRERDRNGWMLGCRFNSAEEGWFPAVYVDQITGDAPLEPEKSGADSKKTATALTHDVYGWLAANRTKSPDQSWVGIEHRVIREFRGEDSTQMPLTVGDVVTVVQALDTGWWLGSHGDRLGWFPGDRVELLEEKTEGKVDTFHLLPACHDNSQLQRSFTTSTNISTDDNLSRASVDTKDPNFSRNASIESILSEGGKPRPARKAPKAPLLGSEQARGSLGNISMSSSLSANPRPVRPAPAPPSQKPRSESVGSMDRLDPPAKGATPEQHAGEGRRVAQGRESANLSRQRKPKVVRIAKEKLGLDKISSFPAPSFHPPRSSGGSSSQDQGPRARREGTPVSGASTGGDQREAEHSHVTDPSKAEALQSNPTNHEVATTTTASGTDRALSPSPPADHKKDTMTSDPQIPQSEVDNCVFVDPETGAIFSRTVGTGAHSSGNADARLPHDEQSSTEASPPTTPSQGPVAETRRAVSDVPPAMPGSLPDIATQPTPGDRPKEYRCAEIQTEPDELDEQDSTTATPLRQEAQPPASEPPRTATTSTSTSTDPPNLPDLLQETKSNGTPEPPRVSQPVPQSPTKPKPPVPRSDSREDAKATPPSVTLRTVSPSEHEEEDPMLEMPPEGVSGRVSMIVHQINRLASSEDQPQQQVRKRQSSLTPHHAVNEAGRTDEVLMTNQPASSQKEEPLQGTHVHNGDAHTHGAESSVNHNGAAQQEQAPSVEGWTRGESGSVRPRGSVRGSGVDGHERRPPSKGARPAPPPPKSPPPPLNKGQRMTMTQSGATQC